MVEHVGGVGTVAEVAYFITGADSGLEVGIEDVVVTE
jgi:hypothetical protein